MRAGPIGPGFGELLHGILQQTAEFHRVVLADICHPARYEPAELGPPLGPGRLTRLEVGELGEVPGPHGDMHDHVPDRPLALPGEDGHVGGGGDEVGQPGGEERDLTPCLGQRVCGVHDFSSSGGRVASATRPSWPAVLS